MNLRLDWATYDAARFAVTHWHYSKAMPSSKSVKVGVWEDGEFIGVVIFSGGANKNQFKCLDIGPMEGCELTRVALKSGHKSQVSRIVSIAMKFLKKSNPKLKVVVSFADPSEGHHGGIYQAMGWIYSGRSDDHKFPVFNGKIVHPRTLSIHVKAGRADRKKLKFILKPGKHRYYYVFDQELKKKIEKLKQPFPKRTPSIGSMHSPNQVEEGGSSPTGVLQL